MTHTVFCAKLQTELPGLEKPPIPGALGDDIYANISQKAWGMWLAHQTMLINEYRLSMIDPKARQFLQDEMRKFLYEGKAEKPAGYQNPT